VLIALLSLLGLVCAAAVGFALLQHPAGATSSGGPLTKTADPVPAHTDLAAGAVPVDSTPELDTSIAPLNSSAPTVARRSDAGGVPSSAPTPSTAPTPTPTPTPSTSPSADPPVCQKARRLRNRNPTRYAVRVELEKLEEACVKAGGSI
jgi:hypothetical protein